MYDMHSTCKHYDANDVQNAFAAPPPRARSTHQSCVIRPRLCSEAEPATLLQPRDERTPMATPYDVISNYQQWVASGSYLAAGGGDGRATPPR